MAMYTPAPLNLDDTLRVTYEFELDSQVLLFVLHGRVTGATANPYIMDLELISEKLAADVLGATGIGAYRAAQSDDVGWRKVTVQRIAPGRDIYFSSVIGTFGGNAVPAAPPNVAMTINKRTLRIGRHGHGDMHLFGFDREKMVDGFWDAILVANMNAVFETYLTDLFVTGGGGPDLKWCLFDPDLTFGGPQDIVATDPNFKIKTMHRRTVGLGK